MRRRACRGMDPAPWFSSRTEQEARARAVCNDCPVQTVCLSWQLEYEGRLRQVDPGMFGGATPAERRVTLGLKPLGLPGRRRSAFNPAREAEMAALESMSDRAKKPHDPLYKTALPPAPSALSTAPAPPVPQAPCATVRV